MGKKDMNTKELPKTVAEVDKIAINGNIIPDNWYKVIVKESQKVLMQGRQRKRVLIKRPFLEAILILSDIVNYHKSVKCISDEGKEYKKPKFSGKRFFRNAAAYSNKFGISENKAREALQFLEQEIGVISQELCETVSNLDGKKKSKNTIDINYVVLKKITHPEKAVNNTGVSVIETEPFPISGHVATPPEIGKSTPPEIGKSAPPEIGGTYTNKAISNNKTIYNNKKFNADESATLPLNGFKGINLDPFCDAPKIEKLFDESEVASLLEAEKQHEKKKKIAPKKKNGKWENGIFNSAKNSFDIYFRKWGKNRKRIDANSGIYWSPSEIGQLTNLMKAVYSKAKESNPLTTQKELIELHLPTFLEGASKLDVWYMDSFTPTTLYRNFNKLIPDIKNYLKNGNTSEKSGKRITDETMREAYRTLGWAC